MNKLLIRQLQKHFGEVEVIPDNIKKLLAVISESYDHYEKDRKLIERSIELSSTEMIELNAELRKEKEELKKAHKELKVLFENIDEVLFSIDMVSNKILQMSAGCEKVYGYTLKEFFDDKLLWRKVIHPDDVYQISQQFNDLRKGRFVFNQYRIIHKDKSIRWIENKVVPTLDENGWVIRIDGVTSDITSRKLAEIELEKSFSIIEATLESTADGILVVDSNNKITRFNNKFLELWQMPREILDSREDKKFIEFVLNQLVGPDAFVARIQQLYNSREVVDFDLVHFKDGRVLERYSQPQFINKKYAGRVWSFRDVTERKKAEEAIRDSEEKRRLIMSGALDAIICIDTNESITFWNPQAEIIFGWKEEEVMGRELSGLIVPEPFRRYHNEGIKRYLETGVGKALNVLLELKAIRRSGEEFPIELTILPIKQGVEVFFCAFIRDITERKKAEENIRQSNERFEKVTQATNDAIWDWDIVNDNLYRGDGFNTLFDYEVNKNIQAADFWQEKFHSEDLPLIKESLQKVIEDPNATHWQQEYRIIKNTGKTATVIDRGIIIRSLTGKAIRMVGAMTDITYRKEYEDSLKQLNDILEQHAQELAFSNKELEQFAYMASHDLQEPLRMVTSFLTLLEKKYEPVLDDKGKKYIGFAVDGAKRMRQIILDLLDYSRAGRSMDDMENIDLSEEIEEIKILFRKEIEDRKATITFNELPGLYGYSSPLRQVFRNLIGNALKYSRDDTPARIIITSNELTHHWQFSIADNGIGIGKEYFDRIFVIFQRLHNKDEYSGTGMGLAITKKIIENMGGKIWLSSEEGKGSIFSFTIQKN
ncbi:MAG: PAS domain S-box protein [Chitinophagaceae bacterium]